jgi:hypothetical protein
VLAIDVNGHPLHNDLYQQLQAHKMEMEEFSHMCWDPKAPHMHPAGKSPIDGAYKSPEVEIVNLSMLTFAESPGGHTEASALTSLLAHSLANSDIKYTAR